jgi:hypothetical protein
MTHASNGCVDSPEAVIDAEPLMFHGYTERVAAVFMLS